jgi:hypothetical protein
MTQEMTHRVRSREAVAGPAGDSVVTPGGDTSPVIVLTYANSGAAALRALLAGHPDLTCTAGTGLLPLCGQAVATWSAIDGGPSAGPSRLAVSHSRAMVNTMQTIVLAGSGKRRWCEIALAKPVTAEAFLQLFPECRILCLYRAYPAVAGEAMLAGRWGPEPSSEYAPFVRAHPGSIVTALAAHWAARVRPLIDFERSHPQNCVRIRHEDIEAGLPPEIYSFLDLAGPPRQPLAGPHKVPDGSELPAGRIPADLLEIVNGLMRELDYLPVAPAAH